MMLLKSCLLLLALINASSCSASNSFLVYVDENRETFDFYETDLNLNTPRKFLSFDRNGRSLNNIFISPDGYYKAVYWSFENSTKVVEYFIYYNISHERHFDKDDDGKFIGVGYYDEIYLYFPKIKTLKVYDFDGFKPPVEFDGLKHAASDMHCVDVDPRDRRLLFFAECSRSNGTNKAFVFDTKTNEVHQTNYQLPTECFSAWKITPSAKRTYAIYWDKMYVSYEEGGSFLECYDSDDFISSFAAGNDEVFFSTKRGKLAKLKVPTSKDVIHEKVKEIDIPKTVNKMAIYQDWQPDEYLVLALERDYKYTFLKTDFNLTRRETFARKTASYQPHNLSIGFNINGDVLHWSIKGLNVIGHINISRKSVYSLHVNKDIETVFIGPGSMHGTYLYSPKSRSISVYSFETNSKLKTLKGMQGSNTSVRFMSRNPCKVQWAHFVECSATNTAIIYDLEQDTILGQYNASVPFCFDTCRFNPNADKMYFVKNSAIFEMINQNSYRMFFYDNYDITGIAVGNNEIFYTTVLEGELHKLTIANNSDIKHDVYHFPGKIAALDLNQRGEC